jgi:hypothetical protein
MMILPHFVSNPLLALLVNLQTFHGRLWIHGHFNRYPLLYRGRRNV